MNFLKRFELWVLLAVVIGGVAWVFTSKKDGDGEVETDGSGAAQVQDGGSSSLALHRITLKRDYGNVRLDLDVRIRNDKAEKLLAQSPAVKLLAPGGHEVSTFFLPFDPPPEVAPKSSQDIQLRYWLDAADLKGPLHLDVNGQLLEVKTEQPLDIETLKNGEEKVLKGTSW